jgi:hypothetical protein
MNKDIRRSLFGYKPSDVKNEFARTEEEQQAKVQFLQAELEKVNSQLREAEDLKLRLEKKLAEYADRERLLADVLVTAHINAQKIEEQAREHARVMLEKSEEELRNKQLEIEALRSKVVRFKDEFRYTLEKYRISLDNVNEIPDEPSFKPILINTEKLTESNRKLQ